MTKTVTIDWKGGSRRLELRDPGEMRRLHHIATAPVPLRMQPESLAFVNATIMMGSELDRGDVESMPINDGIGLFKEVIKFWKELKDEAPEDSDKVAEEEELEFEGIELNENGAVDLEDMQ